MSSSQASSPSTGEKVCCSCGQSVVGQKRLKDEYGQYWCIPCAERDEKKKHGDRIAIGNISLEVLHTPGHTPEHITFLVTDGAAAARPISSSCCFTCSSASASCSACRAMAS